MNSAIAALKAWALAEVVMAALYAGRWQTLRFEDPLAPPPGSPLVAGLELAYLAIFLIAVALTLRWWQQRRPPLDRGSRWAILTYSLTTIASFALWDQASTVAEVRPLYALDVGISLLGLWPALSLIALVRRTAEQP